ncbi:hypothetical protein AAF712_012217 [Marasmius tenuissimus]|uniref:Uncharacterized protein n=1 Tax=Marasmius tenuissimus TaxID=585030 RepID=A0ABR2ZHB6_9AGAR
MAEPTGHQDIAECPTITTAQRLEFYTMRQLVTYPNEMQKKPCFSCHTPSGGGNQFHPEFVKGGKCSCPFLVLPMVFYIWKRKDLLRKMAESFVLKEWETVEDFMKWFTTNDKHYFTQSLRILAWVAENTLKL